MSRKTDPSKFRTCDLNLLKSLLQDDEGKESDDIKEEDDEELEMEKEEKPTDVEKDEDFAEEVTDEEEEKEEEDAANIDKDENFAAEEDEEDDDKEVTDEEKEKEESIHEDLSEEKKVEPSQPSHPSVHFAATPSPSPPPPPPPPQPSEDCGDTEEKENRTATSEASQPDTAAPRPRKLRPKSSKARRRPVERLVPPTSSAPTAPLSDRSGDTSIASKTSLQSRASSHNSRASSRRSRTTAASSTASSRNHRVISNEEKLELKYRELTQLMSRDFLAQTSDICAATMREARQMLHNTYAASRIVSGTLSDFAPAGRASGRRRRAGRLEEEEEEEVPGVEGVAERWRPSTAHLPVVRFSMEEVEEEEIEEDEDKFFGTSDDDVEEVEARGARSRANAVRTRKRTRSAKEMRSRNPEQDARDAEEAEDRHTTSAHPRTTPQAEQTLVGYGVDVPRPKNRRDRSAGSDNKLGNSDNPFILRWLRRKNRLIRQTRREERNKERIEKEIDYELDKVRKKRLEEASNAYQVWVKRKRRQMRAERQYPRPAAGGLSPRPDAEGGRSEEAEDGAESDEGRRSLRGPRPVHNYVFRRSPSPRVPSAPSVRRQRPLRMKVRGERVPSVERTPAPEPSSVRLSYDDWLKQKRVQLAQRRREETRKRKEQEATIDPDLASVVPEMARRRMQEHRDRQVRVDSGLRPQPPRQPRPKVSEEASSEQEAKRSQNQNGVTGPPPKPRNSYAWRPSSAAAESNSNNKSNSKGDTATGPAPTSANGLPPQKGESRRLRRPRSAKLRVAPAGNFGRRPEPCGTDNPVDEASGSADAASPIVEEVAGGSSDDSGAGSPEIPKLDLSGAFLTQGYDE